MKNFEYVTPTRLVFGKNSIEQLPEILGNLGHRVLFTYGGGSIKKNGLYDKVKELLKDFEIYELSGIQPNPQYDPSVTEGVKICKEKKIEVVLAVGGGSVLDCSKAICAGACYEGEAWDLITYKAPIKAALPMVDIITLAATGSEWDNGGVISREATNDKVGFGSKYSFPVASVLDPTYTFTVSKRQTAAGTADAINHVMEQYFCEEGSDLMDGMCEAAIKTLMKNVKLALENPEDYEARAELMLSATLACNGILSMGNSSSGWPCHGIEHALSGYFNITHGEGLAVITPVWMRYILNEKTVHRFYKYAVNVYGVNPGTDKFEAAAMCIEKTYEFFQSIGIPMSLKKLGVKESALPEMAHHIAINEGLENAWAPLQEKDILEILKKAM